MINVLFLVLGFIGMEAASWFIHKYIMHGFLWSVHKTHHEAGKGFFELNDVFSLFFGSCSAVLLIVGMEALDYRFWLGCGIALYGMLYFVFHDVFIHRRIKVKGRLGGTYLRGIVKAHADHHKSRFKEDSVCFGLLVVPRKYFKKKAKQ